MKNSYYDGLVKETDRTLEEIERDIMLEKERMEKVGKWEDPE